MRLKATKEAMPIDISLYLQHFTVERTILQYSVGLYV